MTPCFYGLGRFYELEILRVGDFYELDFYALRILLLTSTPGADSGLNSSDVRASDNEFELQSTPCGWILDQKWCQKWLWCLMWDQLYSLVEWVRNGCSYPLCTLGITSPLLTNCTESCAHSQVLWSVGIWRMGTLDPDCMMGLPLIIMNFAKECMNFIILYGENYVMIDSFACSHYLWWIFCQIPRHGGRGHK